MQHEEPNMKLRVARTIKWNVIDKVASQILYAVTGIVLARVLSTTDFGLVGALLVFQGFATMFIDSGFSYALIQRKEPTDTDYSTVLWFNVGMSVLIYVILALGAPLIAQWFQNDLRLIPLARVMFLTYIINATAIVQTNRLMKRMEVKMIAVSNSAGLIVGAVVGIWMALTGWGAWALVWQAIAIAAVKSIILWLSSSWRPMLIFSFKALRSFFSVGLSMMGTTFLNVLFQNIYAFFIGNRAGLTPLGYYSQADKWSKMGVASFLQVLTSSFLPLLSKYQDDKVKFAATTAKINRFVAYLLFIAAGALIVVATPLFHILFGTKWDASIMLFRLLLLRGIFWILTTQYFNYILALGRSKILIVIELIRDGIALAAIVATLPFIAVQLPGNVVYGIEIFIMGQVLAAALAWIITLFIVASRTHRTWWQFVWDLVPYFVEAIVILIPVWMLSWVITSQWLLISVQLIAAAGAYLGVNAIFGSTMQRDALNYLFGRRQ